MKKYYVFLIAIFVFAGSSFAQVGINSDNSAPDSAAMLDVKSTERGFLPPRMTFVQRNAIQNPVEGLMVYCTNCNPNGSGVLSIFENGIWKSQSFNCYVPITPTQGVHNTTGNQVTWNWSTVPIANGYKWSTINDYSAAQDLSLATTYTETGLNCFTSYTRYVWAYNDCGQSASQSLVQVTMVPFSGILTQGTHIVSNNQIIWNWNPVPGALGYKWGTLNDFYSASEMGTSTTKTETGLSCGNNYLRYIWAYDACGYSVSVEIGSSTIACYPCNDTLTINHQVTNGVAPVDKTVDYPMVTDIPGETSKCWITKNLGATKQATAVSDDTEASAGWYWQFNRKQGYKHDGSTLTPAWTISYIEENSDWLTTNDPCNLELGTTWRLPTYSEWYNVDITGGWTNWNGPWGSGLKLHAAGSLDYSGGSLYNRGTNGIYWTSTQYSTFYGYRLYLSSSSSTTTYTQKAFGLSVRCLRDN